MSKEREPSEPAKTEPNRMVPDRRGKANSARNGIKTANSPKTRRLRPPGLRRSGNEQRHAFFKTRRPTHADLRSPINQESMNLVRQIAIARWQISASTPPSPRLELRPPPRRRRTRHRLSKKWPTPNRARAAESLFSGQFLPSNA